MFSRNDWSGMSPDQRLLSLQGLETQEAAEQERPAATIHPYDYNDEPGYITNGHYNPESNEIYINRNHIDADEPDGAVRTWGHETQHANDHYDGEDLSSIPDPEMDFEGYWEHPQEVGCRNYGDEKLDNYNQNEAMHDSGIYGSQENDQTQSDDINSTVNPDPVPNESPGQTTNGPDISDDIGSTVNTTPINESAPAQEIPGQSGSMPAQDTGGPSQ